MKPGIRKIPHEAVFGTCQGLEVQQVEPHADGEGCPATPAGGRVDPLLLHRFVGREALPCVPARQVRMRVESQVPAADVLGYLPSQPDDVADDVAAQPRSLELAIDTQLKQVQGAICLYGMEAGFSRVPSTIPVMHTVA